MARPALTGLRTLLLSVTDNGSTEQVVEETPAGPAMSLTPSASTRQPLGFQTRTTRGVLAGALGIFQGVRVCALSTEAGFTPPAAQSAERNDVTQEAEGHVTRTVDFLSFTRSAGHFRVRGTQERGLCCSRVC